MIHMIAIPSGTGRDPGFAIPAGGRNLGMTPCDCDAASTEQWQHSPDLSRSSAARFETTTSICHSERSDRRIWEWHDADREHHVHNSPPLMAISRVFQTSQASTPSGMAIADRPRHFITSTRGHWVRSFSAISSSTSSPYGSAFSNPLSRHFCGRKACTP